MELKNDEISQNIREAIKKKLIDLRVYVDDELPDYIMVMVANKKSHSHMTDDLKLFLSENTEEFTSWLTSLLNKLKNIASEGSEIDVFQNVKCDGDKMDSNEKHPASSIMKQESLQGDELALQMVVDDEFDVEERIQNIKPQLVPKEVHPEAYIPCSLESENKSNVPSNYIPMYTPTTISKLNESLLSRKRKIPGSVVGAVVERIVKEEEEGYDPLYPLIGSVASTVKTIRKPSLPPAMQASRSLIMRAVSEAQESVEKSSKSQIGRKIERAIVRPLPQRLNLERKESLNNQNDLNDKDSKINNNIVQQALLAAIGTQSKRRKLHDKSSTSNLSSSKDIAVELISKSRRDELAYRLQLAKEDDEDEMLTDHHSSIENQRNSTCVTTSVIADIENPILESDSLHSSVDGNPPGSPKFIVTLDGVSKVPVHDRRSILRVHPSVKELLKDPPLSILECDNDPNDLDEKDSISEEEGMSKLVRCRFWPTCKAGSDCEYHHPNTPCRTFPNCKFGDQCLNLHPNCKFDTKCSNSDCPFMHSSVRVKDSFKPASKQYTPLTNICKQTDNSICRFFPHCIKPSCPFLHPKVCRFGNACTKKEFCPFAHPALFPTRDKLKWSAQ